LEKTLADFGHDQVTLFARVGEPGIMIPSALRVSLDVSLFNICTPAPDEEFSKSDRHYTGDLPGEMNVVYVVNLGSGNAGQELENFRARSALDLRPTTDRS